MTQWSAAPIGTAKRTNAVDIMLWNGRWHVGAWFDRWPYDQKHPKAAQDGGWIIGGGYVIEPTHWTNVPPPPITLGETVAGDKNEAG